MKKLWTALATSALALSVGTIVAGSGGTQAVAADPIKIGVMGPHSGPAARVGEDIKNGVNMGLEEAMAAGDLPVAVGGQKRNFEFVWVDSESSPEKGIRAVRRAITEDKVDLLMFGWHSSVGLAVIDVSAEYGKIHFGPLPATRWHLQKNHQEQLHPLLQGLAGHRSDGRAVRGGHQRLEEEGHLGIPRSRRPEF